MQLTYGLPAPLDTWTGCVGAAIVASLITWASLFRLRESLKAWGLIDLPNERSLHRSYIPRGGGLAIAGCVLLSLCALAFAGHDIWVAMRGYVACSALMAALGWSDDRSWPSLGVGIRFLPQIAIAALFVYLAGLPTSIELPGLGDRDLGWIGIAVYVVWIVGMTNAFNFMDGLDGLAAGQAVLAGSFWFAAAWFADLPLVAAIALLVAAASWGFLPHNWPPARVFLGDVGSYFLGFSVAALPILAVAGRRSEPWLLIGILLLAPFLFDAALTFSRRLIAGENVFQAHRTHLYQRLAALGIAPATVTALFLGIAALGGLAALLLLTDRAGAFAIAASACALSLVSVLVAVRRMEWRAGSASAAVSPRL